MEIELREGIIECKFLAGESTRIPLARGAGVFLFVLERDLMRLPTSVDLSCVKSLAGSAVWRVWPTNWFTFQNVSLDQELAGRADLLGSFDLVKGKKQEAGVCLSLEYPATRVPDVPDNLELAFYFPADSRVVECSGLDGIPTISGATMDWSSDQYFEPLVNPVVQLLDDGLPHRLLEALTSYFSSLFERDWDRVAGLTNARSGDEARESYIDMSGRWFFPRHVDAHWAMGTIHGVVVRGIECWGPDDEDPPEYFECVWGLRVKEVDGSYTVCCRTNGYPAFGSAAVRSSPGWWIDRWMGPRAVWHPRK